MYFINDEQFTKHGYFEIAGQQTFSKYEAYKLAKQQGLSVDEIKFICADSKLDKIDWSVEPTESLPELFKKRAQQIRDTYDHVVLLYSGGIDSHVILNTFIKNNIKLDEIITIGNKKFQPDTAKINQEVFGKALPYLETLDLKKRGIDFEYIDIGQIELDQFLDQENFENFMYYYNGPLSPWYLALRSHLFKLNNKKHCDIAKSGKKICYMWGYDKPNLFNIDGNWCFKFTDTMSEYSVRPYNNKINLGGVLKQFYDEPFFITSDMPEIVIKQCHAAKNLLNEITSPSDTRLCEVIAVPNTGPFLEHPTGQGFVNSRYLRKKELERVVYPEENPDEFGDDKIRGSVMFTARDQWFFRGTTESRNKLIKKWKRMLREDEDYFKYNVEGFPLNSITVYTKPYIIGKVK